MLSTAVRADINALDFAVCHAVFFFESIRLLAMGKGIGISERHGKEKDQARRLAF